MSINVSRKKLDYGEERDRLGEMQGQGRFEFCFFFYDGKDLTLSICSGRGKVSTVEDSGDDLGES